MTPRVPGVEVADHGDAAGVGGPHGKAHACNTLEDHGVGAKDLGQREMTAFVEQMQVEIAEQRPEGIGIFGFLRSVRPADAQKVGCSIDHRAFEEAIRRRRRELANRGVIASTQHFDGLGARQKSADDAASRGVARPQNPERIAVPGLGDRFDLRPGERRNGVRAPAHDSPLALPARMRVARR